MGAQSRLYDEWLDGVADGIRPTLEGFARSALSADPPRPVETTIRKLDPSKWGFCRECNHSILKCQCDREDM